MMNKENLELMAQYNQWMNESVYVSAQTLSADELSRDRGAFFKSILGTLNHIMVGDLIWLNRFSRHSTNFESLNSLNHWPLPNALTNIIHTNIEELWQSRRALDDLIIGFVQEISPLDLNETLNYHNMAGDAQHKRFGLLLTHFFNHQTHHRGQVTTLLSQQGIDVGVTDLLALISDENH